MLRKERLSLIMREINLHNKVLSGDLSELLSVSEDTIRRDLHELAEEGLVIKVHGGAMGTIFQYPLEGERQVYALKAKQEIAAKANLLFKKNMTVLVEGGTTIMEIAKTIPETLQATFFVLSPQVAITLSEYENIEVIALGGKLTKGAVIHTGASLVNELAGIKVDLCIVGANGISLEEGLTDSDWEIVQVVKAMIRCAKKVAIVSIAEKLNSVQRLKICDLDAINYLITELSPESPFLSAYYGRQFPTLL